MMNTVEMSDKIEEAHKQMQGWQRHMLGLVRQMAEDLCNPDIVDTTTFRNKKWKTAEPSSDLQRYETVELRPKTLTVHCGNILVYNKNGTDGFHTKSYIDGVQPCVKELTISPFREGEIVTVSLVHCPKEPLWDANDKPLSNSMMVNVRWWMDLLEKRKQAAMQPG